MPLSKYNLMLLDGVMKELEPKKLHALKTQLTRFTMKDYKPFIYELKTATAIIQLAGDRRK